jgi:hypothetical protein
MTRIFCIEMTNFLNDEKNVSNGKDVLVILENKWNGNKLLENLRKKILEKVKEF